MKTLTEFKVLFQPAFLVSLALVSTVTAFSAIAIKGYFAYQDRQNFAAKSPTEQLSELISQELELAGSELAQNSTTAGWMQNSEFIENFIYPPDLHLIPGEETKKELFISNKDISEPAQLQSGTFWITVQEVLPSEYYTLQAERDQRRQLYTEEEWLESRQLVADNQQIAVQSNTTKNYILTSIDYGDRVRIYSMLTLDAETMSKSYQQWLNLLVANEFTTQPAD